MGMFNELVRSVFPDEPKDFGTLQSELEKLSDAARPNAQQVFALKADFDEWLTVKASKSLENKTASVASNILDGGRPSEREMWKVLDRVKASICERDIRCATFSLELDEVMDRVHLIRGNAARRAHKKSKSRIRRSSSGSSSSGSSSSGSSSSGSSSSGSSSSGS